MSYLGTLGYWYRRQAAGGGVYGSVYHQFQSEPVSTTTSTAFQVKVSGTTPPVPAGTYRISVSYGWNCNSGGSDFDSRLRLNGVPVHTAPSLHRQEPQDTAGADGGDGSGTDQRHGFSAAFVVTVAAAGAQSVILDYRSSQAGQIVAVWDALVEIVRVA